MVLSSATQAEPFSIASEGLLLEPALQDLGEAKEGEHVFASLLARNNSAEIAQIIDVQASCGCTKAVPAQSILAPGEFTTINIEVDTTGKTGKVKKNVVVTDQAGRQSTAWMTLTVLEPDPHSNTMSSHSIFDGECARCHVAPAQGKVTGLAIYSAACVMCHGNNAKGDYAPDLTTIDDAEVLFTMIAEGTNPRHMPGFLKKNGGPLTEKQIHVLVKWLLSLD